MLRGRLAGLAAQALVIVLVGASPWMAVPYTDLLVMPAVLSGAVLAVGALGARRWWARAVLAAGAASALAVGYVLKSTPASSLAALGVVALVLVLRRPSARFLAGAAAVVAGAAVVAAGTVALATDAAYAAARVDRAQLHLERTPPAAWWVAMGLISYRASNGLYTYGGYNGQMVRDSRGLGGEQLDAWSTQRLRDQLSAMGAGGVARLEANKMVFNWGDGMFFAWGEGSDEKPTLLMDRGSTARAVQSWQHVSGEHYVTRASLVTGLWLFVVLSASLGLLSAPYRRQILALALMVAGIALFTLLFQGRSRYLLSYVPIVVVLATALDPARPFTALWARWRPDLADAAEEGEPSVLSGVRAERSQGRSTCEGGSPFVRMTNTSAKCEQAARLTPWHWTLRRRSAPRSP
jgi:hypothetical protein